MKTILDIDAELLAQAKSVAARENTTLELLMEEGLRLRLDPKSRPEEPPQHGAGAIAQLPVFKGKGGLNAAIKDPRSHQALLDAAENPEANRIGQNGK